MARRYRMAEPLDQTREKEDVLTTLAISALINGTDKAVKTCAERLIEVAPGTLVKSVLKPLLQSDEALGVVLDKVVYPPKQDVVGKVTRDGYEYEIVVSSPESVEYNAEEVFRKTTEEFLKRGIVHGKMFVMIKDNRSNRMLRRTVDLAQTTMQ